MAARPASGLTILDGLKERGRDIPCWMAADTLLQYFSPLQPRLFFLQLYFASLSLASRFFVILLVLVAPLSLDLSSLHAEHNTSAEKKEDVGSRGTPSVVMHLGLLLVVCGLWMRCEQSRRLRSALFTPSRATAT